MKWAIFIPRFIPEKVGGNIIYAYRFAKILAQQGDSVHIFTTTLNLEMSGQKKIEGMTVHRVHVSSGNAGSMRWGTLRKLMREFIVVDQKEAFDIVNPHSPFLLDYKKLRKDLKIIHTLHGVVTFEYLFKLKKVLTGKDTSFDGLRELLLLPLKLPICYFREWGAIKKAGMIVVMSQYVKKTIRTFFPGFVAPSTKIFISKIGIDLDEFKPYSHKSELKKSLKIDSNIPAFLTARRLVSRMGLENLLEACRICVQKDPHKPFVLYIAGKGPLQERLNKIVKKYNLSHCVCLLGYVSDEKLLEYYQSVDAFILPTEELEGFGIVSLEALACNIPVLATPAGANPEVVGGFCDELLCQSPKPKHLAEKMIYFVDSFKEYRLKDYRERLSSQYNWEAIVNEMCSRIQQETTCRKKM